jgi:hypothetical protein
MLDKAILILGIFLVLFGMVAVDLVQDRAINKIKQDNATIKACTFNPAYNGGTVEDQQQLFHQCMVDYKMSR